MKMFFSNVRIGWIIAVCWLVCGMSLAAREVRHHLVRPGETLYSISKLYQVSIEELKAANPKIQGNSVPSGLMLQIPVPDAPSQESAPAASPTTVPVTPAPEAPEAVVPSPVSYNRNDGIDQMAVILPFHLDARTAQEEKLQMRSVEFYEGVLIAADKAQRQGRRIAVQAYDVGSRPMAEILADPELRKADVIVAPMEVADVREVAEYGRREGISVVSPFVYDSLLTQQCPGLFQLNTPKSQLYPELSRGLLSQFAGHAFVFLTDSTFSGQAGETFAPYFKRQLDERNVPYYEYSYSDPQLLVRADSALQLQDRPILYIPTMASREALRRMFPCLMYQVVPGDTAVQAHVSVLGYPEWLLYTDEFMDYYYDLNVCMFSKIYVNPFSPDVEAFYHDFKAWYGRDPMPLIPKYAMLGYDIGHFFLTAMKLYGNQFAQYVDGRLIDTLHSVMCYRREGSGGFLNRSLYLVHFCPNTKIEKYVIQ